MKKLVGEGIALVDVTAVIGTPGVSQGVVGGVCVRVCVCVCVMGDGVMLP